MKDPSFFAIVVSAPQIDQPTREQAELAQQLVNAKVDHAAEVVNQRRSHDAKVKLRPDMGCFFHQGGAPGRWGQAFPYAGRLIAAGRYQGHEALQPGDPPPNVIVPLWETTRAIFRGPLTHVVHYTDVRRIPDHPQPLPLTKEVVGRPPRPGENYIVIGPADPGYSRLQALWASLFIGVNGRIAPEREQSKEKHFTAVYSREGKWWIGYVEELPGANAQAQTLEEVKVNLREAVLLMLSVDRELADLLGTGDEVVREEFSVVS